MSAQIIDGKALAAAVQEQLGREVQQVKSKLGRAPHLAVVLVGDNPASKVYVKSKSKKARGCGIEVTDLTLPSDITDELLQKELSSLSAKPELDGILLQLPLPPHLNEFAALCCVRQDLDVDGLNPFNQGLLMRSAKTHQPCTPKGCIKLIEQARAQLGLSDDLRGLNAVVVGRSILVGKPMAMLLLDRHCTVTVCHSRTKDLAETCKRADILVAAVGRAEMITKDFISPGSIVIDVGINRTDDGRLVGDVLYKDALQIAGAVTPVPGGVGPMTIAMLLSNTVDSARMKIKL